MSSVLIIEDDAEVQSCLCDYLVAAQHDVLRAANGTEAVHLASLHHPDAVVVDVRLPDIDGVDLAQRLRDLPSLATIPILFLTGNVDSHVVQAAHWMQNTSLLRKPCDHVSFVDKLNESLEEHQLSQRECGIVSPVTPVAVESQPPATAGVPPPLYPSPDLAPARIPSDRSSELVISEHWPEFAEPETNADAMHAHIIALEDLVDEVSHDARSTLFVLSEFARQAADGLEGPDHAERVRMLQVVEDRTVELQMLFDMLQAGRRINAGAPGRVPVQVRPDLFLASIVADCEHLCHRKSCSLSCSSVRADVMLELFSCEVRAAIMGLFAHVLSIVECGSAIHIDVDVPAGTDADRSQFQLTVAGRTATERTGMLAAAVASDRAFDPCSVGGNPKLLFAASIAQLQRGGVSVAWTGRLFQAVISFAVRASAGPTDATQR